MLNVPVAGVDIYVTNKAVDGKTLVELAKEPTARGSSCGRSRGAHGHGFPSCEHPRSSAATSSPWRPHAGHQASPKLLGVPDRRHDVADCCVYWRRDRDWRAGGRAVFKVQGSAPDAFHGRGALIAGIVFGWLRSVRPFFGHIPSPTIWFMNSGRPQHLHCHRRYLRGAGLRRTV